MRNRLQKVLIEMGVLILFLSTMLSAQNVALEYTLTDSIIVIADKVEKIPEYTTIATKLPVPILRTPVSSGVVTEAMIENQHALDLGETLENISGINAQTGFGVHDYFIIRGFNTLDNGLILSDGIPEPEVIIYNLYNLDRVEVLKGPGAFLYGANPLSGTINLVRKRPVFSNFGSLSLSSGSFSTYRGALDAGIANRQKTLAARVNGLWNGSKGYREDKDSEVFAINPTVLWRPGKNIQMEANVEFLSNDYMPDTGIPLVFDPVTNELDQIAAVDREQSYQSPADKSNQDLVRARFVYEQQLSRHLKLVNKLYYNALDWQSTGTLINGAYPTQMGNTIVQRSLQKLDDARTILGNQLELYMTVFTGGLRHDILFGLEANRFTGDYSIDIIPQLPVQDLYTPTETYTPGSMPIFPFEKGEARQNLFAPYFLDVIDIKEKAKLYLGGRYDRIAMTDDIKQTDRDYQQFSPFAGVSVDILKQTVLYANAGQAFAPPSIRIVGEPEPEKSRQFEIGLKRDWLGGKIRSTLAVYDLRKENISIPVQGGLSQQSGDQRSRGIELDVAAQMTENCATLFSYTYTDAELTSFAERVTVGMDQAGNPLTMVVDRSGNDPAFVPTHMVNFWHTRQFGDHFGIGAGIRYMGEQFIAEDNGFKTDSYTTLDASVYYLVNRTRWSLNLKNITDTEVVMRGFGPYSVLPAAPVAIYGELRVTF
jgi:iron complex outermembrane recepter protein